MLKKLIIKNFALIDDLEIDFYDKMTVLTGKTGTGKSLIIDTISLLLGNRAENEMIKDNEDYLEVTGYFYITNKEIIKEYDLKNNELIIYRKVSRNNKNIIKINNENQTLVYLKNLTSKIADIHAQFDINKLLNKDSYLEILDNYSKNKIKKELEEYQISYFNYKNNLEEYKKILNKNNDLNEKIDYLKYQYNELETILISEEDYLDLENKINIMSNYDKIYNTYTEVLNNLDNDYFNIGNLYDSLMLLKKIENYDYSLLEQNNKLETIYYELEEIISNIKNKMNNLDFNPNELDIYQEKYNEINKLIKKYHKNIKELLEYKDNIKKEIDLVENYDEVLKNSYNELLKYYNILKEKALKLSSKRKESSQEFCEKLIKDSNNVDLENIKFEIVFNNPELNNPLINNFNDNGIDDIDFLVTFNKGESLKPLNKVASGGELSRLMLIIKSLYAKESKLSLIIFDEIDTGISGETAIKIATKIKELSHDIQILAITHLPQVAAVANNHIKLIKEENNNHTKIKYKYLNYEDRIKEIAMMLSGNYEIHSLELAKSLIK